MLPNNKRLLIALDIDGTLIKNNRKIAFKTKHLIRKLDRQGHIIVLSSGRPSRALLMYHKILNLHSPMVCYNGAFVYDPKDDGFKKIEYAFDKATIKSVFNDLFPKYIKNMMCETDKDIYLYKDDPWLKKYFWYENMNMHYGNIIDTLLEDPMTFIVQGPKNPNDENEIRKIVSKYKGINVRFWSGSEYYEIYSNDVSKGKGIMHIAKHYGILDENIIAFGDAENDIDMLEVSHIKVAMKNGEDGVKKAANMISCKDNQHNGVYYTLKEILRTKKL